MLDDVWGAHDEQAADKFQGVGDKASAIRDTVKDLRRLDGKDDPWIELVLLMADSEEGDEELTTFVRLLANVRNVNDIKKTGVALIHYTIVYNHAPYIEMLHEHCYKQKLNVNILDKVVGYSPLMWCFQLMRSNCCIELFPYIDELNFDLKNRDGNKVWDLVVPGTGFEEFLDQNNIFQYKHTQEQNVLSDVAVFNEDKLDTTDDFDKLDLQVAGLNVDADGVFSEENENNGNDAIKFSEFLEDFEFDRLLKDQYLEFSDFDIPKILDLLISLPQQFPHITTYPAAFIFQCVRYADHKLNSKPLVESLVNLSLTRIIAIVSDDPSPDIETTGDIVTQSYWLSVVSFLYYYFCRDDSFFRRYPTVLQDIINTIHTLMIETTSSIHSRLLPLMEPTILAYTTIDVVKQTLYKRDWNFFKRRKQSKIEATKEKKKGDSIQYYDKSMLEHLAPPSLEEQMKPSPMKVVQIFGALAYVLELHQGHPIFQQQCLSLSINWFASTLFNRILKNKKKKTLSRAHAIQIRLNLSSLETWIKNNDLVVPKPHLIDDFMWERFPYTLVCELGKINSADPPLRNVATYRPTGSISEDGNTIHDNNNSLFFYQPFHKIAHIHLEPVFELLQWLQIATTLTNEESLDETLNLLPNLTAQQLLKAIDKYNYETEEPKFNSTLRKKLSNMIKMQTIKENPYLLEKQVPLLALPTIAELTDTYTRGAKSRSYQPLLPIQIQDSVYEIHDHNTKLRRDGTLAAQKDSEDANETKSDDRNPHDDNNNDTQYRGVDDNDFAMGSGDVRNADEYFKELDAPMATVQKPQWNSEEIEANPW